jgi:hypothetical protein
MLDVSIHIDVDIAVAAPPLTQAAVPVASRSCSAMMGAHGHADAEPDDAGGHAASPESGAAGAYTPTLGL